jgi:hypothetical protein
MKKYFLLFYTFVFILSFVSAQADFYSKLADSAFELTKQQVVYDPQYRKIDYPNGDVQEDNGVCSDVIIRAYRKSGTIKKTIATNNDTVNKLPVNIGATVYSNPLNGYFHIILPPQTIEILIYNSNGKLVNKAITEGLTGMDYYVTCKGIYLIQIVTENQIINRKLIVSD